MKYPDGAMKQPGDAAKHFYGGARYRDGPVYFLKLPGCLFCAAIIVLPSSAIASRMHRSGVCDAATIIPIWKWCPAIYMYNGSEG